MGIYTGITQVGKSFNTIIFYISFKTDSKSTYYGLKKWTCKLGLLLYKRSLILNLMIEQIGGASFGGRSKNFIFTRRAGETGNT